MQICYTEKSEVEEVEQRGIENGILTEAKRYVVAVDEVDCMGRIKPSAWLMYMQDVATDHAEHIGVGFQTMREQDCYWVMTQVSVRIHRYVRAGSELEVRTFPLAPGLVDCIRDYEVRDAEGTLLAQASARWCVIDGAFRIRKARPFFAAFAPEQYKPDIFVPAVKDKLVLDGEGTLAFASSVRYTDMDRNHHLNNVHYADLMLDAYGEETLRLHDVTGFDVAFRGQTFFGESYEVYRVGAGDAYGARGVKQDGKVTFEASFTLASEERGDIL